MEITPVLMKKTNVRQKQITIPYVYIFVLRKKKIIIIKQKKYKTDSLSKYKNIHKEIIIVRRRKCNKYSLYQSTPRKYSIKIVWNFEPTTWKPIETIRPVR